MVRRNVTELRAGMVLAEDVMTPGGRFLMPKGTTLDPGHLKSLLAWNLPTVAVNQADGEGAFPSASGPGAPPAAAPGPDLAEAAEAAVRERLLWLDLEHEAGQVLFRLALEREIRRRVTVQEAGGAGEVHGLGQERPERTDRPNRSDEAAPPPLASPEALLRDEPQLVSPPEVYLRINEVLRDPKSTVEDAAASIRYDPSLAAKLLRLVNSSYYARTMRAVEGRFPAKVDSLSRAVMVVGARQLATLALGVSVLPLFQDIPPHWVNMRVFWEHSVGCAVAAQAIAAASGRGNPETAFVAGLLHDIGRILAFKQAPAHMAAAMRQAAAERLPLSFAERGRLGFDHAALGGHLLQKWQFPANLEKMVRYHHDLDEPLFIEEPAVIHLADGVATALGWGGSGNRHVGALSPAAWEALGLSGDALARMVPAMEARLAETMRSFFPDRPGPL
ncbi:metal dependent phosphohydrolase [Solidesulfovibrio carbinoliphilus subsp. oakridgensis]|uniref:Metal dependent phosphohydrolase n=1 Tax=Solidesulfovibrio carbinoliphilus subsp. oakridgensis TaxID=694327 RepID=G7QCV0_9BACT|nr:HDOD domain-containing protein [Solidesulfovibrio carbinoliphilus]EHJ46256.1 metal dependent phosphohydrolase [Solidesulfovibrio carbinoliphilus subsp. oakridgensis]